MIKMFYKINLININNHVKSMFKQYKNKKKKLINIIKNFNNMDKIIMMN